MPQLKRKKLTRILKKETRRAPLMMKVPKLVVTTIKRKLKALKKKKKVKL